MKDTLLNRLYLTFKEWSEDKRDIKYAKKYLNDEIKLEETKNKVSSIAFILFLGIEEFLKSDKDKIVFEWHNNVVTASSCFPCSSGLPTVWAEKFKLILEAAGKNKKIMLIVPNPEKVLDCFNHLNPDGTDGTFEGLDEIPFMEINKVKELQN